MGKPHQNLGVTKYIREVDPWTHWYACPMTGDPVNMTIKTRGDHTAQIMGKVTDSIVRADAAGGWMVAVWHPEATQTRIHLHQFNYSNDEKHIEDCIKQFREQNEKHGQEPKKAVLVEREPPAPKYNMFAAPVVEGESKPSE